MLKRSTLCNLWFVIAALTCPALAATNGPATIDQLHGNLAQSIDRQFRQSLVTRVSGSIIVETGGKTVLEAGYGWANRERKIPFTTRTIGQIGSLSKQFTAMALIDLWRQRKIDFSKQVKAYLPQTAEPVASVTLDQLLTHTSGMPLYCGGDFERRSKSELLSKCAAMRLAFRPGTKFSYSNPEFSIIAAIVERAGGEPIDAYLKDRFFAPLGMRATGYEFPGLSRDDFAVGYIDGKPQGVIDQTFAPLHGDYWNLKGNGGMQASPRDMDRWFHALCASRVVTSGMRDTAFKPRFHMNDDVWAAYGWNVHVAPGGHVFQVGHSGSDGAFLSYFYWRPDDGTFFYFVSNSGTDAAVKLLKGILAAMTDAAKGPSAKPSAAQGDGSKCSTP